MNKTILLVEDNADVQDFNRFLLEDRGFSVETALTIARARECVAARMPDAIVLDIGMPDGSGLNFLSELRKISAVPVLLLTGYTKDADVVRGFTFGGDDYLSKPYTFEVLLARLERLLKSAEKLPSRITYGSLTIDVLSGKVFLCGDEIFLSQKEFALLLVFTQHITQVLGADYLYEKVWGQPINDNFGALKTMVYRLRKKIKGSGYDILAEYGQGYVLEPE